MGLAPTGDGRRHNMGVPNRLIHPDVETNDRRRGGEDGALVTSVSRSLSLAAPPQRGMRS